MIKKHKKIMIMGLPGSGKTTLARELAYHFLVPHINADTTRENFNDWDFSEEGRDKQARRMGSALFGILDFVCPTQKTRTLADATFTIWMDTIKESEYEDTNALFEPPTEDEYDIRITEWIGLDQLRNSLEGSSPGIEGISNYLREEFPKLVK